MPADSQTIYNPRIKEQIRSTLYDYLYAPVDRKLRTRIKEIVIANSQALASSQTGFSYRNEWYTLEPDKPLPRRKDRLVPQLREQMEAYLAEKAELTDHEMPYVMGFIVATLNASDDMRDYLLVFPSPLHPPLKKLGDTGLTSETRLSPDAIAQLQDRNAVSIELVKSRLVTNLLLQ